MCVDRWANSVQWRFLEAFGGQSRLNFAAWSALPFVDLEPVEDGDAASSCDSLPDLESVPSDGWMLYGPAHCHFATWYSDESCLQHIGRSLDLSPHVLQGLTLQGDDVTDNSERPGESTHIEEVD